MGVLEVDLELGPGEEILVDPGLAVPEHTEHQSLVSLLLVLYATWKPTLMTT